MTGAGIPAPGGRRGSVMNPGETETVKENAYRRDVRTYLHGTSGCSNRRLRCRNKPKVYRCGSRYDRGKANNALCFDGGEIRL